MAPTAETILWRRIDPPGHEAARLLAHGSGWHLAGTAVFGHEADACCLQYVVGCDAAWQTVAATVSGWVGDRTVDLEVTVDSDRRWWLNGSECPNVAGCFDIDMAFSPSTNTLPIRRLNLQPGDAAVVRAAWLRFPEFALEPLVQRYSRIDLATYRYESGGGVFTRTLRTNSAGFVVSYPEFWEVVHSGPAANQRRSL